MSGSVANYGGRQPDNTQNIKQFNTTDNNVVTWIYKTLPSGLKVQTPADKIRPVYINSDLYVNGSIYNTSDAILKENVVSITDDKLGNMMKLKPMEYNFKADSNKKIHYGMIAQDVEKVFPELIIKNINGHKTINYIEFIPMLISNIQNMQKEIDELKSYQPLRKVEPNIQPLEKVEPNIQPLGKVEPNI
jgi:hypothetical protein